MKKFVSLLMCCVFAISAFAVFPQADEAITVEKAVPLIKKMVELEGILTSDVYTPEYWQRLDKIPQTDVSDDALLQKLREKATNKKMSDSITFSKFDGEYGDISYWNDSLKTFLTDDFVEEKIDYVWAILEVDGAAYTYDDAAYATAPGRPNLITEKPIEEYITIVDNDTVLFESSYESFDGEKYEIDFEYTENGWRISGGDATEKWLHHLIPDSTNPDTSDNGIVIVVCATAALVGIALTVNKRRFAR